MWTDISYLYYNWTKAYLSILKDMVSWEILSHKISSTLWLDFGEELYFSKLFIQKINIIPNIRKY